MENYELGELPEPLRAWAKFRPADSLDFSRRAKSLASTLQLPLQKTQDAYAIACGYSGRHELQQVLRQEGEPGPYDDAIPDEIAHHLGDAHCFVQFYRHTRLLSALDTLISNLPDRYCENRDTMACDLALFSSPSMHLRAAKAVKGFLSGESGYSPEGFPFGYRGYLHRHYLRPIQIDEASLAALSEGWAERNEPYRDGDLPFDPRQQNRALLSNRAPLLFKEMAEKTASEYLRTPLELEVNEDLLLDTLGSDEDRWLLADVDLIIAHSLCDRIEWKYGDEELDRVLAAIRSVNHDAVAASSIASTIPDFADALSSWRFSIRYQIATLLATEDIGWERPPNVCIIEGGSFQNSEKRWLSIFMQEEPQDISVSRWRVRATLLTGPSNDGPWVACASLAGDYVVASRDDKYASAAMVIENFDEYGEETLSQAWKVLSELYLPVAGFLSYHEWVNEMFEGGGAAAVFEPWVAPAFRGTSMSRHLINDFVNAFDEGMGYVWDSDWRSRLDPRLDTEWDLESEEDPVCTPGLILIPLPGSGVLGYSVWDEGEEATTKLLRLDGERLSRSRRFVQAETPVGLGPHLLHVVKRVPIDVVLFDPHSGEGDSEDS